MCIHDASVNILCSENTILHVCELNVNTEEQKVTKHVNPTKQTHLFILMCFTLINYHLRNALG